MNYIKITGACLIVICCTSWGFYCAYRLNLRIRFLSDFAALLTNLQTNIRYFSDDIIRLICLSAPPSLSFMFDGECAPFPEYWKNAVKRIPKSYNLKNDDYNKLCEFGAALGTTDAEGQVNHIQIYKNAFEQSLKSARKERDSKSRLYKTLGFFAGMMMALLII